ncbi:hypothetical protein D3Z38_06595 [Clostridiales bacterium]|nr:hypothetical protein [Clostridiales bacterium]
MSDQKNIIDKVEYFYIEIVEEFKEAEQKIINDSKFRSLFRKKNYDGNIALLKDCKGKVLGINIMELKKQAQDQESKELTRQLGQALAAFRELCDAHVRLQVFLKKKARKEDAPFSQYKDIFNRVKQCREEVNSQLHGLDILYTDYTESDE